jgi:hypothetical protein
MLSLVAPALSVSAQYEATEKAQHHYPHDIPPGNYSGIVRIGEDRYAVVNDKSEGDGFFVFRIEIDSVNGEIRSARNSGFYSSGLSNRDEEDIAYDSLRNKFFISGEADNQILEYRFDATPTGRQVTLPDCYKHLPSNLGLESLTFDPAHRLLWTCNESDSIHLYAFNDHLQPVLHLLYRLDSPVADASVARNYVHGVSAITALDDGSLLLLEREFYVPKSKIGSWVECKLYQIEPFKDSAAIVIDTLPKRLPKTLLLRWKTNLSLLGRSLANYEGMCLGPRLTDGSRVLVLIADSQNQYAGVLRDWFKTIVLKRKYLK